MKKSLETYRMPLVYLSNRLYVHNEHYFNIYCIATFKFSSTESFTYTGITVRVFANCLGDQDSIPGCVMPKTQKNENKNNITVSDT